MLRTEFRTCIASCKHQTISVRVGTSSTLPTMWNQMLSDRAAIQSRSAHFFADNMSCSNALRLWSENVNHMCLGVLTGLLSCKINEKAVLPV